MRLVNRIAIITGGSRGIGRAVALAFAHEGAKVAVVGRNKTRCDEVVAQISKNGGDPISIQADVSSEADVAKMVEQTKDKFKRIDILVNNAAVNLPYRTVTELSLDEWNRIIGFGKIINLASIGGRIGAAGRAPYRASKAAIINFTECLAAEVKEFNIDVNAICPGAVETDMMSEITGGEIPKHAMPPEDIAAVAVFLASDESRAITGTAINAFGRGNPLFGASISFRRSK